MGERYTEQDLVIAGIPERLRFTYTTETKKEANSRLAEMLTELAESDIMTCETALNAYMSLCEKWDDGQEQYDKGIDRYGFAVDYNK